MGVSFPSWVRLFRKACGMPVGVMELTFENVTLEATVLNTFKVVSVLICALFIPLPSGGKRSLHEMLLGKN